MSEEQEGGMSAVKKTIIGIATTAVTAAGAYVTTHIEAIFGGGEEEKVEQVAAPAPAAAARSCHRPGGRCVPSTGCRRTWRKAQPW